MLGEEYTGCDCVGKLRGLYSDYFSMREEENKEKRTDDIEPWDQEFLKADQGTLFELILVSLRVTISRLLRLYDNAWP